MCFQDALHCEAGVFSQDQASIGLCTLFSLFVRALCTFPVHIPCSLRHDMYCSSQALTLHVVFLTLFPWSLQV